MRCYYSGPKWTWERWQWRGTTHSPKLEHYWNLTIRLFCVIPRTLIGGVLLLCSMSHMTLVGSGWVLPLCREVVGVFYNPSGLDKRCLGCVMNLWGFSSYPRSLVICWSSEGIKDGKERDSDTFELNFDVLVYNNFAVWNFFPEPVEINVLLSQGV